MRIAQRTKMRRMRTSENKRLRKRRRMTLRLEMSEVSRKGRTRG